MTTRRDFLAEAAALAAFTGVPARIAGAAEALGRGDLTLGVLSDIHINVRPGMATHPSIGLFRNALEYFRARRVDGVLIAGDLADAGLENELAAVARTWFEVFPKGCLPDGTPVANLMHYGDHDAETRFYTPALKAQFADAGLPVPRSMSEGENRREIWERLFHEPWSPILRRTVRGYAFILSNFMREGGRSAPPDLAARLAAMRLDASKPFFYSQHRWMKGTYLTDEEMWGSDNGVAFPTLSVFPNAVAFQGHTHYTLTDDRGVWIGRFIAINTGALRSQSVARCRENGPDISWYKTDYMRDSQMPCVSAKAHAGQVMTLRDGIVTLERRDFARNVSLGPDLVFSLDPALRARTCDAARAAASVPPNQPDPASVTVTRGPGFDRRKRPVEQVTVSFPTVRSDATHPRPFDYAVRALAADGSVVKEKRVFSPGANLPERCDAPVTTCVFAAAETRGAVRYTVTARNCWGRHA